MNMFRAFMELDEAYNSRQAMIDDIKETGKQYNFDKFTDAQLFRIWQRLQKPVNVSKEPKHELDLDFDDKFTNYCDCGTRLSDAGFCPVCYDGEEDLTEDIVDEKQSTLNEWKWKVMPNNQANSTPALQNVSSPAVQATNSKYVVNIVSHGGRLRALSTDGTHPAAWVAFPNDLRQFEGQKYEVDQLIWNGKNYRVAGNIIEI